MCLHPVQFSSVAQLCLTLCNPMDCSTLGFPVHHQFLELAQTHVHRDGISRKWKWKWSRSVVSDSLWPMDCSPPSSSVHGILQARILEWVVISFSRGSSQGLNPGLPHCRQTLYCLSHQRSNKSERERQILHINTSVWNLGRWYWWTYLQGSSGDIDVVNRFVNSLGGGGWDELKEQHGNIYYHM